MKKILFVILLLFLNFAFTNASSIKEEIINNYEYIKVGKQIYSNTGYVSNKGNNYYFVGSISFREVKSDYIFDMLKKKDDVLYILKEGKILGLEKDINSPNFSQCTKLNSKQQKIFNNHPDIKKIKNYELKVLGRFLENEQCFIRDDVYYYFKHSYTIYDVNYFMKNYDKVLDYISNISIESKYDNKRKNIISSVYGHIIGNVEYDYQILKILDNLPPDRSAWRVAPFFQGLNVVCDGYVKTFLFILGFFDIQGDRVVGKLQPVHDNGFELDLFHSWVKIGDSYYDLTFDDTGSSANNKIYFDKSKKCFNITHYRDGWEKFETEYERFVFLTDNFDYFINNCNLILKSAVFNDDNYTDILIYSLKNEELRDTEKLFCDLFNLCDIDVSSKDDLINTLKNYTFTITKNGKKTEFNLYSKLSNYKEKDIFKDGKFYALSDEEKSKIETVYNNFLTKLDNKTNLKKENTLRSLKAKINQYKEDKELTEKQLQILNYLLSLISIEN